MPTYNFSNLDFESLKADLIKFIKATDEFADYEFEGSALNSIASLLTYSMLQQNYYLNMTTQELYLSTASLYKNAVAIAKSLNYIPHRKQSASISTTIAIDQTELILDSGQPVLIPSNCSFLVDGVEFITNTSYNIYDQDPIDIIVYQRSLINENYLYQELTKELLYGVEVDEGYFTVTVDGELWTEYQNQIDADENSEIYFLDNNLNGKLEISFGEGIIGKAPLVDAVIDINYGITTGADGNNLKEISLNQPIYSGETTAPEYTYVDADCTIVSVSSSGGTDEETIQSIKVNAPKFYEAQNRAVTKQDYQILLGQIPFLETTNIWDGAEIHPPTFGTVYGTFKPVSGPDNLTDLQKETIISYIQNYMPLTLKFVIKNPIYIYLTITSKVFYYESYQVDTTVIRAEVEDNINTYFTDTITIGDTTLKYSSLLETIDAPEEVSNNLTTVTCHLKFDKAVESSNSYVFELGNAIRKMSIDNTYLKDDGLGNIVLKSNGSIVGSVDYETGDIYFIFDGMDLYNNILDFVTEINDIYFVKENLPVLDTIILTFEGV